MQLETALTGQNGHRQVVVVAALTNPITCTAFHGGDQLILDSCIFFQQVISWIQQGISFDTGVAVCATLNLPTLTLLSLFSTKLVWCEHSMFYLTSILS